MRTFASVSKEELRKLVEGQLEWQSAREIMDMPKDSSRFGLVLEVEQERVGWPDKILLPLSEGLYLVARGEGAVVKCRCGHEFGDYRSNWKEASLVYERDPDKDPIHLGSRACDPEWMVLREFFCPGCLVMLEVEAVPPGYPFIFDFLPDLDELKKLRGE